MQELSEEMRQRIADNRMKALQLLQKKKEKQEENLDMQEAKNTATENISSSPCFECKTTFNINDSYAQSLNEFVCYSCIELPEHQEKYSLLPKQDLVSKVYTICFVSCMLIWWY